MHITTTVVYIFVVDIVEHHMAIATLSVNTTEHHKYNNNIKHTSIQNNIAGTNDTLTSELQI